MYDGMCKMQCVKNGSANQTIWMDQLGGPVGWTSWIDQFFLFEALASSHIRRFSSQFVHCRSFRVRRRPCFLLKSVNGGVVWVKFIENCLAKVVTQPFTNAKPIKGLNPACKPLGGVAEN